MVDVKQLEVQYVTNQAGEKTAVILTNALSDYAANFLEVQSRDGSSKKD